MGIFGTSSSQNFDTDIEKATSEKNVGDKWGIIMDICDKVNADAANPKECLKIIVKRLNHNDPHVVMQAITLLDACINNCGKPFQLEIASRDFETEFRKLLSKTQPKVTTRLKACLKSWAEGDFNADPQLNLIPSLYQKLKSEGHDFSDSSATPKREVVLSKDPNVVSSQQEEDDIAKAIELSLKEKSSQSPKAASSEMASSLYPSALLSSAPAPEPRKVRALYEFEAAEDNELTFSAGEILMVLDDTDPNWWKGQNQRGEGLFPSNFVTADLSVEPEAVKAKKNVQFSDEQPQSDKNESYQKEQTVEINEENIDRLLHLLHEADPEDPSQDSEEMLQLEMQVNQMGPLIDAELERVDRKHAQLTQLSGDLVDAINLYHTLMREPDRSMMMGAPPGYGMGYPGAQQQQQHQPQPMFNLPGVFTHNMPNMYQIQMQHSQNMAGPTSLPPYAMMGQLRNDMSHMNVSSVSQFPAPQHTQPQQSQINQPIPQTSQNGHSNLPQQNGPPSLPTHMPPQQQQQMTAPPALQHQHMQQQQQQQQQMPNMTVQSMVGPQTSLALNMLSNMPPSHMQSPHPNQNFNNPSIPSAMPPQQQQQQQPSLTHPSMSAQHSFMPQMPYNQMQMGNMAGIPFSGNMSMMQQVPRSINNTTIPPEGYQQRFYCA